MAGNAAVECEFYGGYDMGSMVNCMCAGTGEDGRPKQEKART